MILNMAESKGFEPLGARAGSGGLANRFNKPL